MTAITDLSDYKALIGKRHRGFHHPWASTPTASSGAVFLSFWSSAAVQGGVVPSTPSTAVALDNTVAGALDPTLTDANQMFIAQMEAMASGQSLVPAIRQFWLIADRLSHQGGLSGTTTGAQTTNLPTAALTRYTSGVGVWPCVEVYSAIGTTATTVTCSYTNQAGTSGQTSVATPIPDPSSSLGTSAGRVYPLPLQSGDTGCRAVASVTLAASTLTAGNFGVTLLKPLVWFPAVEGYLSGGFYWDALFNGAGYLPEVLSGAHLMLLSFTQTAALNGTTNTQGVIPTLIRK